jgi:hypothetical protein
MRPNEGDVRTDHAGLANAFPQGAKRYPLAMKPDKFSADRIEGIHSPQQCASLTGIFGGGEKGGFVDGWLGRHVLAAFSVFYELV